MNKKNILLVNDDGYNSAGITSLFKILSKKHSLTIVAPLINNSGMSSAMNFGRILRMHKISSNVFAIDGTPADCIHVFLNNKKTFKPDLVISGINHGLNIGDDIYYSGTIGAALQSSILGLPAIAVSLDKPCNHFFDAALVIDKLVEMFFKKEFYLGERTILNVCIPDIDYKKIKGFRITNLSKNNYPEYSISSRDPYGDEFFWIGKQRQIEIDDNDCDISIIKNLYVSLTPININFNNIKLINYFKKCFKKYHENL